MMDSGNYSYWNALGVVSMNKGITILVNKESQVLCHLL